MIHDGEDGPSFRDSDRVLRLANFDLRQPERIVTAMRDYWSSLRQGRAIPARAA